MTQHSALKGISTHRTPQSEPIPGSTQVQNSAGGYTWEIDRWARLKRFLILGVEGGTYYTNERINLRENMDTLRECVAEDGPRAVAQITAVSINGQAASNDPALFALAYCAKKGDDLTRKAALNQLSSIARTGTHLFHFMAYLKEFGTASRGVRRAISEWYHRAPATVAYDAIKYRQRDGWSHRDVLRMGRPRPESREHRELFAFIVNGRAPDLAAGRDSELRILEGYLRAQDSTSAKETAKLVREYGLPREALPTEHLNDPEVWRALLDGMPMTAMIRNLANMTRLGLLTGTSEETAYVLRRLGDEEAIRRARIHPIAVLAALKTYAAGHGMRGDNTWTPVGQIVDALDAAFYLAFGNVKPTGKRLLLALDVSRSMLQPVSGLPFLTAREASAAMALVTAATEARYEFVGFTAGLSWRDTRLLQLDITPRRRLDDVVAAIDGLPFGGTDCSLPMRWAQDNDREVDAFVLYTDNETWAGPVHPSEALRDYRRESGINARSAVVATASNGFTIADPNDRGMLDVVGFDTSTPNLLTSFVRGDL